MKNKAKKTKISDVASYAGVSQTTVSNYINEKYEKMAEETKQKIQQAIDILEYVPSLSARRLSAKVKSKTICLIIPRNLAYVFDSIYFSTVFSVVGKAAEEAGYSVLIYSRNRKDNGKQMEYLLGLAQSLVDGFIIFDLLQDDFYFKEFENYNIPYVCVGKIADYEDYHYVASDHGKGIIDAMEYLISLGHKKIGAIEDNKASVVEMVRKQARDTMIEKYNLPSKEGYFRKLPEKSTADDIYQCCEKFLKQEERPTAVLLTSTFRHSFIRAAKDNGIRIPDDISVVAIEYYDDYEIGYIEFTNQDYTRIESKAGEVSRIAFKKLLELIDHPDEEFESCLTPLKLTEGKTTKKLQ
ncbi:MAG TPA: LacI family DNA-binding transcriptional regulator [Candidatus Pelethocola excrementipullorum]|nr:LacI family DNA-binding transcriptional regulator [Candidatus Pelethocola excrementipullorum]